MARIRTYKGGNILIKRGEVLMVFVTRCQLNSFWVTSILHSLLTKMKHNLF